MSSVLDVTLVDDVVVIALDVPSCGFWRVVLVVGDVVGEVVGEGLGNVARFILVDMGVVSIVTDAEAVAFVVDAFSTSIASFFGIRSPPAVPAIVLDPHLPGVRWAVLVVVEVVGEVVEEVLGDVVLLAEEDKGAVSVADGAEVSVPGNPSASCSERSSNI